MVHESSLDLMTEQQEYGTLATTCRNVHYYSNGYVSFWKYTMGNFDVSDRTNGGSYQYSFLSECNVLHG